MELLIYNKKRGVPNILSKIVDKKSQHSFLGFYIVFSIVSDNFVNLFYTVVDA